MSILGILLTAMTAKASINKEAFLTAIAEVESGNNHAAIGKKGERGAYQFTKDTWDMHSKFSHHNAHFPNHSVMIAFAHLDWLISRVGDDPVKLAIAWNGGPGAVKRPTSQHKSYAQRVVNLYHDSI